jgi:site-specific DNA recombinase
MLEDIRAGTLDAVVVWALDRLHRRPMELEEFFDVCEAAGLRHLASVGGDVDLATGDGKLVARIKGAVDAEEIEKLRRRITRKHEELAYAGMPSGGGRAFGYEDDMVTVRPDEAQLIREAMDRVLAGTPLGRICAEWTADGVQTVTGRPWRTTTLRRMLTTGRVAGYRYLKGERVAEAVWPAIVDRAKWERCRQVLLDPQRKMGGRPREYLLTGGLAVCGRCGVRLLARPTDTQQRKYICAKGVQYNGCGKLGRLADPLEALIRDAVLYRLASRELLTALAGAQRGDDRSELYEQLRTAEEKLEKIEVAHFTDGHLSRAGYLAARQTLQTRAEAARRALSQRDGTSFLLDLPAGKQELQARWDASDNSWRRNLVAAVVERVIVNPAVKGRNLFDPSKIDVVWRA